MTQKGPLLTACLLLANLALVEKQLPPQQDGAEPFLAAVAGLRDSFTGFELLALCVLCNLVAALGLVVFWRRPALRAAGAIALLPALGLTAELLVFGLIPPCVQAWRCHRITTPWWANSLPGHPRVLKRLQNWPMRWRKYAVLV